MQRVGSRMLDSRAKQRLYPSRPPHSVSLPVSQFPVIFLKKHDYDDDDDDDDDIIKEFATSCPLLVL